MDIFFSRFNLLFLDLLLPLFVGYVIKQRGWLTQGQCDMLVKINIRGIVALLSLFSFWSLKLTWSLALLPIIGVLACIIPGIIARYTGYYKYDTYTDKGAYMMASMLANIGTLSGLGAFIAYGIHGFAYVQMIAIFQNLFTMLFCFPLANYYYHMENPNLGSHKIRVWELLFNWNQVAVIFMCIGFFCSFMNYPEPSWGKPLFTALVHIGAWAGLVPVGYMISVGGAKSYLVKTWDVSFVKFVVLPCLAYVPFTYFFHGNHILIGATLLAYASPTAINAVLASNLYKLNEDITIASFLVTTTIYLLIIFPVFYFWGRFMV